MEPRLKTSTQWTPFPSELCEQVTAVLSECFKKDYDLDVADFVVEGRIYQGEILGRYGLRVKNQLKQPNFEVSFDFDSQSEKALELIQNSMDLVEHLWTEFLEDDREDDEMLMTWQSLPFQKRIYFVRYSTVNTALEEEADKLLAEYEKKLVYGTPSAESQDQASDEDTIH